jgi:hypothetical protein
MVAMTFITGSLTYGAIAIHEHGVTVIDYQFVWRC